MPINSPATKTVLGSCPTAHRSNRPAYAIDRSAVGELSSLSSKQNGSDCQQAIHYVFDNNFRITSVT